MPTLTNWSVVDEPSEGFTPSETIRKCLHGYSSARGGNVRTSPIVNINGRMITTHSGSVYMLVGDPNPEYLAWMAEHGYCYNPDNPIGPRPGSRKV